VTFEAVGMILAFALVFFVPRIFMLIGANRDVAWLSKPPRSQIFRRSSRETLALAAYVILAAITVLIGPPHLFFVAAAIYIAGSFWAWLAPPDAKAPQDATPAR
jgi:hypothetical protein